MKLISKRFLYLSNDYNDWIYPWISISVRENIFYKKAIIVSSNKEQATESKTHFPKDLILSNNIQSITCGSYAIRGQNPDILFINRVNDFKPKVFNEWMESIFPIFDSRHTSVVIITPGDPGVNYDKMMARYNK